jgi:hypothetical protein
MNTMSQPSFIGVNLTPSRNSRFTRFRTTALPNRFPTAKPHRVPPSSLGNALSTTKLLDQDFPLLMTASNCVSSVSRFSLPISHREPLPPFLPPPPQHGSTTPRRHARQEPMFPLSWYPLWLIGSFWHYFEDYTSPRPRCQFWANNWTGLRNSSIISMISFASVLFAGGRL